MVQKSIFDLVKESGSQLPERNPVNITLQAAEELGELAKEVNVIFGNSYKKEGKDGILGEGIDLLLAVIDIIQSSFPDITEEEIMLVAGTKCQKWVDKTLSNIQK